MPSASGKKKVMACACGYTSNETAATISDEVKSKKEIEVVTGEEELDTLPTTEAECPKCGHKKAYYWLIQTRAADEPETKFLKCCECKHTYRDYN